MRGRALALLAVHFLGGILSSFFSADQPAISSLVLISTVLGQSCLLGMWGGLSSSHFWLRLGLVVLGTVYLYLVLGLGIDELDREVYYLVALATFVVAVVCWCVRLLRKAVLSLDHQSDGSNSEGLQFSIWHVMLLTLIVACLLTIGKIAAPFVRGLDSVAQLTGLSLCYAAVALTSIWAILGLGHPALRGIFLLMVALIAGIVAEWVFDKGGSHRGFWAYSMILQSLVLAVSLLVVRRMGYRLISKAC